MGGHAIALPTLHTLGEAAGATGRSYQQIWRAYHRGELPVKRIGGRVYVVDLAQWLRNTDGDVAPEPVDEPLGLLPAPNPIADLMPRVARFR